MTRKLAVWVLSLAALSLWACSSKKAAENVASTPPESPRFETADTIMAHAHVLAVDKTNRTATIQRDMGDTVVVAVGPEVKNFDQMAAGDVINATYIDKLTIRVEPAGNASTSTGETMSTANPGEKPGLAYRQYAETKATIVAIDKAKGTASLVEAAGDTLIVTPAVPENLDKVKVGDLVVFTHTEDVAVSVGPARKK
jgi:hypothetical protein